MSLSRSDPARLPFRFLCAGALLCVATLTLIDRGATRAYSTPWIFLFWFAHLAPLLALALRALPGARPLILPSRPWCTLAAVFAAYVILSALVSPFRGPSLLAALTPLAGIAAFFLIHDLGHHDGERLSENILRSIAALSLAILVVSLSRWAIALIGSGAYHKLSALLQSRNEFPLGHSNYTAGLALLILPWFGFLTWRTRGVSRAGYLVATLLALAMLFTSGSRGGLIGAAALAVLAVINARVNRRMLILLSLLAAITTLALGYAHPRTRAMIFSRRSISAGPNLSNVQRSAMAIAGWRMGLDRPLLGWGPGNTPLVYPKYRAGLDGGVETALQLHSTPVQLWADLGIGGVACAMAFFWLIWRASWTRPTFKSGEGLRGLSSRGAKQGVDPAEILAGLPRAATGTRTVTVRPHPLQTTAILSLAGYAVFALTDYQLDVPMFTLAVATCAALIAKTRTITASRSAQLSLSASALIILAGVAILGNRDLTPELNVRALALGADPKHVDETIALLNQSLALNPDQEIAHFNLGWLLIVRDPIAAEKHFITAAHLVPDKGGVYFGLALARLNQNRPDQIPAVVRALALECLNDPRFLISPWWRQPDIAALRIPTLGELRSLANTVALRLAARKDRRSREADYVAVLGEWLDGKSALGEILARSHTSERVSYFAARPQVPAWKTASVKAYHRERPGYPVLMRNLDLPPPVDLFEVQENSLATGELAALFPAKGWLPSPLLIELLDENISKIK